VSNQVYLNDEWDEAISEYASRAFANGDRRTLELMLQQVTALDRPSRRQAEKDRIAWRKWSLALQIKTLDLRAGRA